MPRTRVKEVINSTGRIDIKERDVSLTVSGQPAVVRLLSIDLPDGAHHGEAFEQARVWIEATQQRTASFDRWQIGKVAEVRGKKPASVHELVNFSDASDATFSIKIVSPDGRILASADKVRPDDQRLGEQEALLPIRTASLGEVTWTVQFAEDGRTYVVVNNLIPAAQIWAEENPLAYAVILPAAATEILTRLVEDEDFRSSEWGKAWLEWAAKHALNELPDEEEDDPAAVRAWVAETVAVFCQQHLLATKLIGAMNKLEAKE